MRAAVRTSLLLAALLASYSTTAAFGQGRKSQGASVPSKDWSAVKQAIETRFRQLDASADMKLGAVNVAAGRKGEAVLELTVTPPASRALDTHAQTVYSLIFETLAQAPGGFADLTRIKLSLVRSPHGMTTDCPVKVVEDSLGYMTLATLHGKCVVR